MKLLRNIANEDLSSSSYDAYNRMDSFSETTPTEARRTIEALGVTKEVISNIVEEEANWVEKLKNNL